MQPHTQARLRGRAPGPALPGAQAVRRAGSSPAPASQWPPLTATQANEAHTGPSALSCVLSRVLSSLYVGTLAQPGRGQCTSARAGRRSVCGCFLSWTPFPQCFSSSSRETASDVCAQEGPGTNPPWILRGDKFSRN